MIVYQDKKWKIVKRPQWRTVTHLGYKGEVSYLIYHKHNTVYHIIKPDNDQCWLCMKTPPKQLRMLMRLLNSGI